MKTRHGIIITAFTILSILVLAISSWPQEMVGCYSKGTNYGLYGNDKMVCSEASRFILVEAGLEIADTDSPIKKLLGIYFGPANFYS
ncbi:MAG: hypothetical protein JXO51_09125, partial [Candidatus Aminicenantes bacterium]|nr:hypothetical protein [Candidatus Aminicenantes bacterium]